MSTLVSDRSQQPARQRTRSRPRRRRRTPRCPAGSASKTGGCSRRAAGGTAPGAAARDAARGQRRAGRARGWAPGGRQAQDRHSPRPPRTRRPLPPRRPSGKGGWLAGLLALAERHAKRGEEVFVAPAVRSQPRPRQARRQPHARAVGRRRQARAATTGCGRCSPNGHATCWSKRRQRRRARVLAAREPLDATRVTRKDRRAGRADRARAPAADPPPRRRRERQAERRRHAVRRTKPPDAPGGTVNNKTGQHARILEADLALPAIRIARTRRRPARPGAAAARVRDTASGGWQSEHADPYKTIPPPEYFELLAGINVPAGGGRCPAPHTRPEPFVLGRRRARAGMELPGRCGARGAIYDLASVLLGGPTGQQLRGEEFKRAQAYVRDVFGELT